MHFPWLRKKRKSISTTSADTGVGLRRPNFQIREKELPAKKTCMQEPEMAEKSPKAHRSPRLVSQQGMGSEQWQKQPLTTDLGRAPEHHNV